MINYSHKKSVIIKHLIIWLGIYVLYYSFNKAVCTPALLYVFTACITFCDIATYYFISFVVYPLAEKERYLQVTLAYVASFLIHFFLAFCFYKLVFPNIGIIHSRSDFDFIDFLRRDARWYVEVFVVGYAGMLSRIGLSKTKLANKNEEYLLHQELNLYKNQFHSHLTFNFLNFCYLNLRKISNAAANMVEHYSNMLMYSLHANKSKLISLEDEIDYLTNFIALQKYLSNKVYCDFSYEPFRKKYEITPLVLGILVEFAFKHGQIDNAIDPITINLKMKDSTMLFSILFKWDSKHTSKIIDDAAINQLNKYLLVNYKHKHELKMDYVSKNTSSIKLNIILDDNHKI